MKEYKLTVEFHNGARYCYYGKTKKEALAAFRKSFGSFKGFVKKEWEIISEALDEVETEEEEL